MEICGTIAQVIQESFPRPKYRVQIGRTLKCLIAGGLVLVGGVRCRDLHAAEGPDHVLEGEVTVEIRGLGAAPLGIASAVFSSTAIAYNLGRIEQAQFPVQPVNLFQLPGVEVYHGSLRFTLERRGKRHWSAKEFSVQYSFDDRTRFSEDKVVISDSLHASGEARWRATPENTRRAGRWESPPGWRPGFRPKIDLRTFEAPSVEDCEDPGWAAARMVRTALTPEEQRVTCYELKIHVAHPVEANGSSVWTSPIGEARLEALDGIYRFSGSSVGSELAKGAASMPLPPGTPPETVRAIRSMGELAAMTERWLGGGMPEVDLNTPWTWERTYRGELRNDSVMVHETFPILTGATVYETARVGEGPIVDIYRDGTRITGKTIDVVVGERLNLEGVVEMADGPVTAWQWEIPGDTIERFQVCCEVEGPDCEGKPVKGISGATAYPDFLEADERQDKTVSFLWWDKGPNRVVLRATAGDSTGEAEVVFKVEEPAITVETDAGDDLFKGVDSIQGVNPCGTPLPEERQFVVTGGKITKPDGYIPYAISMWHKELPEKFRGDTQYVQLIREDGTMFMRPEVAFRPFCWNLHTSFMLDASYPYREGPQMSDWPGIPINTRNTVKSIDLKMTFQTWLMYRPKKPDADWVPLRVVDWAWRGVMAWNPDRLEYDDRGSTVRVTGERAADSYPEWSAVAREGKEDWKPMECPPK